MFNKKYDDRLRHWSEFRSRLETSESPIQDAIDFYTNAPLVSIMVDPYDKDTWLDPWQLLLENKYCDFSIILGILYTLKLTDRFSNEDFEIHIITNKEKSEVKYLLYIGNIIVGYDRTKPVFAEEIPNNLKTEKVYSL